jgi:hypothetical protein
MNKLLRVLFTCVALALGSAAHAQTLWTAAQYGMTVEQVKAAFPSAVPISTPDKLYGGSQGLLTVPGVHVAASDFHAIFYFNKDRLVQVTLASDKKQRFESMLVDFHSVEEILRAKYGPELQRKITRGSLDVAEESWLAGPTNISLYGMGVRGSDALLNINYQVRISKDADKL